MSPVKRAMATRRRRTGGRWSRRVMRTSNRAGRNLSAERRRILNAAKHDLRKPHHRGK